MAQLKSLCAQMNIRPHRRKGQHFLVDPRITRMMANVANLSKEDTVLEIGPGFGVLTEALLARAGKVVAVENDRRLVKYLREKFAKEIMEGRLELIEGDILRFQILDLRFKISKVVANIPYAITSQLITSFFARRPTQNETQTYADNVRVSQREVSVSPRFELLVLMVQKEVAERITAKPPRMSRLAVFVQFHAEVKKLTDVSRILFWPEPEVDSAIVMLRPRRIASTSPIPSLLRRGTEGEVEVGWEEVEPLVAAGFAHPRKQLHGQIAHLLKPLTPVLSPPLGSSRIPFGAVAPATRRAGHQGEREVKEILASCGVSPLARPGELSVEQWIMLAQKRSN